MHIIYKNQAVQLETWTKGLLTQNIYVVANGQECDIVVSEFELQSFYYVHCRTNVLGKCINSLIFINDCAPTRDSQGPDKSSSPDDRKVSYFSSQDFLIQSYLPYTLVSFMSKKISKFCQGCKEIHVEIHCLEKITVNHISPYRSPPCCLGLWNSPTAGRSWSKKGYAGYDIKLHLMVRLLSWSFRECDVPLCSHYFQNHSVWDWK